MQTYTWKCGNGIIPFQYINFKKFKQFSSDQKKNKIHQTTVHMIIVTSNKEMFLKIFNIFRPAPQPDKNSLKITASIHI